MGYIRAEDVLPSEVLTLVQKYVDGQMLYVPKKNSRRRKLMSIAMKPLTEPPFPIERIEEMTKLMGGDGRMK